MQANKVSASDASDSDPCDPVKDKEDSSKLVNSLRFEVNLSALLTFNSPFYSYALTACGFVL